jgi:hypothetical protein
VRILPPKIKPAGIQYYTLYYHNNDVTKEKTVSKKFGGFPLYMNTEVISAVRLLCATMKLMLKLVTLSKSLVICRGGPVTVPHVGFWYFYYSGITVTFIHSVIP